jgi:hypothetical protein
MQLLKNGIFVLFSFLFFSTNAQVASHFTVHIGSFANPKPLDFEKIRPLGFIYSESSGNVKAIRMGGYSNQQRAEEVALAIRNTTGDNAQVMAVNVGGGMLVPMIQLGTEQANKPFSWQPYLSAGQLFFTLDNGQVKIMTGQYPDMETARAKLATLRTNGFPTAFPKEVNNVLLHPVGNFELGGEKRPLIPLDFSQSTTTRNTGDVTAKGGATTTAKSTSSSNTTTTKKEEIPNAFEETTTKVTTPIVVKQPTKPATTATNQTKVIVPKSVPLPAAKLSMPTIRGDVKRNSAYVLQTILKEEKYYKSSLDGFYGKGTKLAYETAKNSNRQIQKYRILSEYMNNVSVDSGNKLQEDINNLWANSQSAMAGLDVSDSPLAKAYQAYFLMVYEGIDQRVNDLMNGAIKTAFAGKKVTNIPRFDYNATYAYNDLDQLLLHLRYIHEVSNEDVKVPCWMFQRHPGAALRAFDAKGSNDFLMANCGGFNEWEEIRILQAMAQDLSVRKLMNKDTLAMAQSTMSRLYLAPKSPSTADTKALNDWNKKLWLGIEGWAIQDPMLIDIQIALKIIYYQSYVLLEDHFMDAGFSAAEAKTLALEALQAAVGYHLDRFV